MTPSIVVLLKKLTSGARDPLYGSDGAAGCDVHADEGVTIAPRTRSLVSTGLCMQMPDGYECQVRPRSGLALRDGVIVFNTPSTIDCDYRGELKILLLNTSDVPFVIERGMRVAQLVFAPVTRAAFRTVEALDDSKRGTGGWGSTGRGSVPNTGA